MANNIIDFNDAPKQQVLRDPETRRDNPETTFQRFILDSGYNPPNSINPDGKIHRFGEKKECWYVFFSDGVPAGAFGSWKTGMAFDWCSKKEMSMTREELYAHRARMDAIRVKREEEERIQHEKAAKEANDVWLESKPVESHPYLASKGVQNYGLKTHRGLLVVPAMDPQGRIHTLQTIGADGGKLFHPGGQKKGMFFPIPGDGKENKVAIAEGYATAASIREATGWETIVAFDAGNLMPVAKAIRQARPGATIVICADDDHATEGNPGVTKANEAAREIGCRVAVPKFKDATGKTDFNDLHQEQGPAVVRFLVVEQRLIDIKAWGMERYQGVAPEREYLVDGIFPLGCSIVLAAQGGAGKGFLGIDLALKVASDPGTELFPVTAFGAQIVSHGPVVMFLAEDDKDEIHRRINAIGRKPTHPVYILPLPDISGPIPLVRPGSGGPITTEFWKDIEEQLIEMKPKLIVIDPMAAFFLVDINADPACGQFVQMNLASLAKRSGATIITAHHMSKDNKGAKDARGLIRGTTAIVDGARGAFTLVPVEEEKAKTYCEILETNYEAEKVWSGKLAKANYKADREEKIFVRNSFGLLEVQNDRIKCIKSSNYHLLKESVFGAIKDAEEREEHFTRSCSSTNGMYNRKTEIPIELENMSRDTMQDIVDELIREKRVDSYGRKLIVTKS